jgi:DNA repair exonuclease SbcCD ATPase subunit
MTRPYLNFGLNELRAKFEADADDSDALKVLADELLHRKTPAARSLADEVSARIKQLRPGRSKASSDRRGQGQGQSADGEVRKLKERVKQLEAVLDTARHREIHLEQELAAARAQSARQLTDFGRVHLADTAPPWLIAAVRTAFRKQYHPDRYQDPIKRQKAHEVFVAADAIFDKLEKA